MLQFAPLSPAFFPVESRPLSETRRGDASAESPERAPADRLMSQVYDELRSLANRHMRRPQQGRGGLQPTEVVHEVYLRLADAEKGHAWDGRTHFFAVSAHAMRRILVDEARRSKALKRGGQHHVVTLDQSITPGKSTQVDVLDLDEALNRLAELSKRQVQIVELRFFGGLTVDEVAEVVGVSRRTVLGDWSMARAWLRRELAEGGS